MTKRQPVSKIIYQSETRIMYKVPSTEAQQGYLARLIEERDGAEDVTAGFLDANGLKSCMELLSSQASKLIDMLKTLKKK